MMVKNPTRTWLAAASIVGCAVVLAGCESARFGGRGPVVAARQNPAPLRRAAEPLPDLPPAEAIPSDAITSEPLAPPPGSYPPVASTSPPAALVGNSPATVVADVPTMPGSPRPIETMTPAAQSAAAPAASGSSRSASVGGWTAREASGGSCRVQLSSTPALDLYKASASGCTNKDLSRITSWDFRDGEVYLYQPGGAVAARLRTSAGTLQGVLAKSGAPLTLSRS